MTKEKVKVHFLGLTEDIMSEIGTENLETILELKDDHVE